MKWLIVFCMLLPSVSIASLLELKASCDRDNAQNINFFSIVFIGDGGARVEVNTNQIYVVAKEVKVSKESSDFFFDKTDSIGLAGANINWGDVSKQNPMFTLHKLNDRDYVIHWYGFFDEKKGEYLWSNAGEKGADLYSQRSIIQNCQHY
ncbi:hypothetical protein [Vibrio mexicanus]|uniref:hypothetical protein n=1 Tax=Vibrio mexicanus TaxID=1004326 RepID=UPI00063C70A3|nr:hypothetical protein [Vibrio mexicanus]